MRRPFTWCHFLRMPRSAPFRTLLLGLVLATLVLAVWLALNSTTLGREAEESFFTQYNKQQLLAANHTARGLEDAFGTFKRSLTLTANLFNHGPVTFETAQKSNASLKAIYNVISDTPVIDLVVFDKTGTVVGIVPEDPTTLGENYSWRGYYKWAKEEGKPDRMYLSPFLKLQGGQHRGDMAIMVAEGIYDKNGGFQGVAMITVNFDELMRRHILSVKMGERGYAWLIDSANGTILVDPRGKVTGQSIEQAFLPRWEKLYKIAKDSARGEAGLDWYDYEDPNDPSLRVRKLVAYAPVRVEQFLWTVGVCTPEEEVSRLFATFLGRQQSFSRTVIYLTLTGAMLFLGLLLYWNRSLSKEVEVRTSALEEARGKLENAFSELLDAKKLAAVGHLALGLVHEIRNPLSSIRMNMQMVRKRLPTESPSTENFRIMEEEILRLNRLLGDVMVFARPTPLRPVPTDMPELVRRALILIGEKLNASLVTASAEWPPDFPKVNCDPEQITQVLLNLFLNALHALENFQGERKISVSAFLEGDLAVIEVADTGPGIAAKHMESLFDPFFTTKAQGGGLGLSIAQRIAQSHGGTLEAEKDRPSGALFRLKLPLAGPPKHKDRET